VLEPGEECDDGNAVDSDGCVACVVECETGEVKHPMTYHCYRIVDEVGTWTAALASCEALGPGSSLAALSTFDEIYVLQPSLPSGEVWVGANDLAMEGTFIWHNGEPWTYVNGTAPWASAEPNNNGGNEDCVEIMSDGLFNDRPCIDVNRYACERTPPPWP
jgi:cysteine-rich repeat protein